MKPRRTSGGSKAAPPAEPRFRRPQFIRDGDGAGPRDAPQRATCTSAAPVDCVERADLPLLMSHS
jgi:hypothetical protein